MAQWMLRNRHTGEKDFFCSPLCGAATHKLCLIGTGKTKVIDEKSHRRTPGFFLFHGYGACGKKGVELDRDRFADWDERRWDMRPWFMACESDEVNERQEELASILKTVHREEMGSHRRSTFAVPLLRSDCLNLLTILYAKHPWQEKMERTSLRFVDGRGEPRSVSGFHGIVHSARYALWKKDEERSIIRTVRFQVNGNMMVVCMLPTTRTHFLRFKDADELRVPDDRCRGGVIFGPPPSTLALGNWWKDMEVEDILRRELDGGGEEEERYETALMHVTLPTLQDSQNENDYMGHLPHIIDPWQKLVGLYRKDEAPLATEIVAQSYSHVTMDERGVMMRCNAPPSIPEGGERDERQAFLPRFCFDTPGLIFFVMKQHILGVMAWQGKKEEN